MNKTSYPGIDYGSASNTNVDPQTGIHYGVIPQHELGEFSHDEIASHSTDLDLEDFLRGVKDGLRSALSKYFSDYKPEGKSSKLDDAVESAFDSISDDLDYQQMGDCTRYLYEKDGLTFQVASDGDIFVLKSPCYTYAQFCSPCAPGACYLTSPLDTPVEANKCYCLPADWFDDDKAPYPIHYFEKP